MSQTQHQPVTHTRFHSRLPADTIIARFIELFSSGLNHTPMLIAVGGPGGSGKTTFSERLRRRLSDCGVLHLDNYKTSRSDRSQRNLTGPHPEANRMQLVTDHFTAIKSGQTVTIPIYDSLTGDTGSFEEYRPCRFNIVEGEIATYHDLRSLIDLSIFIDSDFRTQLSARIGRDIEERGHSLKKAINTFLNSNLTEFTQFGAESKQWSDIHLFCHDDYHFSIESVRTDHFHLFQSMFKDIEQIEPAGLIVPVTTPFENDLSICRTAFIDHLSYLTGRGVTRLIIGGTTAEFFSLSISERLTLLKLSREYFPGYIMFNISDNCSATAAELAKRACRYGADALICLPPCYYANAPQSGIIRYFQTVIQNCELPFYLYNFPKHTGNPITPEILSAIPHHGLKDSSADLSLISRTGRYLLGGDSRIVEAYRQGACGFIPGLPNAFPEIYLAIECFLSKKNYTEAEKLQQRISSFKKTLPPVSGIVSVKQYLNRLIDSYPLAVRPPLVAAPEITVDFSENTRTLITLNSNEAPDII